MTETAVLTGDLYGSAAAGLRLILMTVIRHSHSHAFQIKDVLLVVRHLDAPIILELDSVVGLCLFLCFACKKVAGGQAPQEV